MTLTWLQLTTAAHACLSHFYLMFSYCIGEFASVKGWVIHCQEDMKCWNCHTMGNHICGKIGG